MAKSKEVDRGCIHGAKLVVVGGAVNRGFAIPFFIDALPPSYFSKRAASERAAIREILKDFSLPLIRT